MKENIYEIWKQTKNTLKAIINTQNYSFLDPDYIYYLNLYKEETKELILSGFNKDILSELATPLGINFNE